MYRLFTFLLLLSCSAYFNAKSQTPNYVAVHTAEQIPWQHYTPFDKRFIVAGEAHHVSSIFPFQLSHLEFLVTKGFRNLVWEMPYSYSLIGQQYILTGNDSLLQFIAWSQEDSVYWKSVYQLNKTLPEGDKLHLWGIDIELAENVSGGAYRTRLFKKAFFLLREGRGIPPPSLQQEFVVLDTSTSAATAIEVKHRLQKLKDNPEVAIFFGERLPDFIILVNRLDYFKALRNGNMLDAFREICSFYHLDSTAKFLGRFGWGHTDKSYKKSMSFLLENDPYSPVKNSTYVIGVQFLNCTSWSADKKIVLENYGIVDDRSQKQTLATINQQDSSPIKIFTWPLDEKRKGWAKAADVLFVFSGYPAITPRKLNKNVSDGNAPNSDFVQ